MTDLLDNDFVLHMEKYHPASVTARLAVEVRRLTVMYVEGRRLAMPVHIGSLGERFYATITFPKNGEYDEAERHFAGESTP